MNEIQTLVKHLMIPAVGLDLPEDMSDNSAWIGHIPFAMWLVAFLQPERVVELGTHCGDSYFAFCQSALKYSPDSRLYAVDTWSGDKHAGFYSSEIFERVRGINEQKYSNISKLLRKTFDQALNDFDDDSVDLLHIDGLHTYEAVKHDFECWLPKLRSGAIVLFHDTVVKRDDFGVYAFWDEISDQSPSLNFSHSNGLGVLIVGESENEKVRLLADLMRSTDIRSNFIYFFAALGEKCEFYRKVSHLNEAVHHAQHLEKDIQNVTEYARHLEKDLADLKKRNTYLEKLSEKLSLTEAELIRLKDEINRIYSTKIWRYSLILRKIRLFFMSASQTRLWTSLKKSSIGRVLYGGLILFQELRKRISTMPYSKANISVINRFAQDRFNTLLTKRSSEISNIPSGIDLTAVIYNNSKWLEMFLVSLTEQDYPADQINLFFVDNGSTDNSLTVLKTLQEKYRERFRQITIIENSNIGFGAGHDIAIRAGNSSFVLVANIDLEFEQDAIVKAMNYAVNDSIHTASWEFRQKPYEHPKYYDPVTLETSWSSHACVLIRRSAYEEVGGYEKRIFMYGEDVELSYRFRDRGFQLKYLPAAVVNHYTYDTAGQVKPAQFSGSTQANALIRFRYGSLFDKIVVLPLQFYTVLKGADFPGSRMLALKNQISIMRKLPFFWNNRKNGKFPFYGFDYEMTRYGSFYTPKPLPVTQPLVSIITRTYRGRERFLKEAIASVMNQTYTEVEHIIVEDGGDTMQVLINEAKEAYPNRHIRYADLPKKGRSFAGNSGMELAAGKYLVFLDDDDLLFADHIETLVGEIEADSRLAAVYSLALEVETSVDENGDYYEHSHGTADVFFQEFDRELLLHHSYIPIQSILFRRSLFEEYGGFDLEMNYLEDWNLWCKYALNAEFKFVPKTTSLYRTPHDVSLRLERKKQLDNAYSDAVERQKRDISLFGMRGRDSRQSLTKN